MKSKNTKKYVLNKFKCPINTQDGYHMKHFDYVLLYEKKKVTYQSLKHILKVVVYERLINLIPTLKMSVYCILLCMNMSVYCMKINVYCNKPCMKMNVYCMKMSVYCKLLCKKMSVYSRKMNNFLNYQYEPKNHILKHKRFGRS